MQSSDLKEPGPEAKQFRNQASPGFYGLATTLEEACKREVAAAYAFERGVLVAKRSQGL